MAGTAAASPATGQLLVQFHARLREEAGDEPSAAAVLRAYAEAFRVLTFNCKPVITELTIIADQHTTLAARGITNAICVWVAEVGRPSLLLLFLKLFSDVDILRNLDFVCAVWLIGNALVVKLQIYFFIRRIETDFFMFILFFYVKAAFSTRFFPCTHSSV
jgi:hypothetical protein